MVTKAVSAREIPDPPKEAVADSILNNLSARVSGKGEFHRVKRPPQRSTSQWLHCAAS